MTDDEFLARMKKIRETLDKITDTLRKIQADLIYARMVGNKEEQEQFVEKLYDPFYEPTPVDEIVIQYLLEDEKRRNG